MYVTRRKGSKNPEIIYGSPIRRFIRNTGERVLCKVVKLDVSYLRDAKLTIHN